ncbi:hypothetical protein [Paenibacillus arenosi]|nr:hypothetical protein [Paenibacillus arenosi]
MNKMHSEGRMVTVFAPNAMGVDFLKQLRGANVSVAAISNNTRLTANMEKLGVKHICNVRTTSQRKTMVLPTVPVGRMYVFEQSFALTCRLLQQCRPWTDEIITVITKQNYPKSIYRMLGADLVIYTQSDQVSFLLTDLLSQDSHQPA